MIRFALVFALLSLAWVAIVLFDRPASPPILHVDCRGDRPCTSALETRR